MFHASRTLVVILLCSEAHVNLVNSKSEILGSNSARDVDVCRCFTRMSCGGRDFV